MLGLRRDKKSRLWGHAAARSESPIARFGSLGSSESALGGVESCEEEIRGTRRASFGGRKIGAGCECGDLGGRVDAVPSHRAMAALLRRCGNTKDLGRGKKAHVCMLCHGFESELLLGNLLLSMYIKCDALADAARWFRQMHSKDVVTWTSLVGAYAKSGDRRSEERAWDLLRAMTMQYRGEGAEPNAVTFLGMLKACRDVTQVNIIHALVVHGGFDGDDDSVRSALLDTYAKCGSIRDACAVFARMRKRHVVAWNAMIAALARREELHGHALDLFRQMQARGIEPDEVTCLGVLGACRCAGEGRRVHAIAVQRGMESSTVLANSLIGMYASGAGAGGMADASRVFDRLSARDVVSWSAMLAAYVAHGRAPEALHHFGTMLLQGVEPNKVTYMSALKACARSASWREGHQIHMDMVLNHAHVGLFLRSSLIDMYCGCGGVEDACNVFAAAAPGRDAVVWNSMIGGLVEAGESRRALALFWRMLAASAAGEAAPDEVTLVSALRACAKLGDLHQGRWIHSHAVELGKSSHVQVGNCLLDVYAKCSCTDDARRVFDAMPDRPAFVWTSAICGYVHNDLGAEGLRLFDRMKQQEGLAHAQFAFSAVPKACADLEQGKQIHVPLIELRLDSDVRVGNSLVDMYARCGGPRRAAQVLGRMPRRDAVTYNTLATGLVRAGNWHGALRWFWRMETSGVKADAVSFACVLRACAGLAALEQGMLVHGLAAEDGYDGDAILAGILVDMYAKCGSLLHARRTFDGAAEPDAVTWTAIVSGYAQHGRGREALELLAEMLESEAVGGFDEVALVGVLSACSSAGLLDEGLCCCCFFFVATKALWSPQHHACVLDLLGRAGCSDSALDFALRIPAQPPAVVWSTLLAAGKLHGDVRLARYAASHVFELEPADVTACVLLSNANANANAAAAASGVQQRS